MASVGSATHAMSSSIAVGSGGGVGVLIVWLLGLGGVDVPAAAAAGIATALGVVAAAVHQLGIRGIAQLLWRGEQETAEDRYRRRHQHDHDHDPPAKPPAA